MSCQRDEPVVRQRGTHSTFRLAYLLCLGDVLGKFPVGEHAFPDALLVLVQENITGTDVAMDDADIISVLMGYVYL